MATVNVGTEDAPFYIERCSDCLGLFFDPGELDSFVDHTIRSVFSINQLALASMSNVSSSEVVRYRKCPVCSKLMNRINFGKSSGVIVDQCQDHGIYLDAGELHRILAWVRLGGKLRAQANTDAETEAASRTVAQARKYLDQPSSTYQPGMENAPETMVSKVTDFLIKIMGNT
jgi:Zn-finger nucleic acid-binding protein